MWHIPLMARFARGVSSSEEDIFDFTIGFGFFFFGGFFDGFDGGGFGVDLALHEANLSWCWRLKGEAVEAEKPRGRVGESLLRRVWRRRTLQTGNSERD